MCRSIGEYIPLELFCCAAMTVYLSVPCSTGGRRPTSSVFRVRFQSLMESASCNISRTDMLASLCISSDDRLLRMLPSFISKVV